jgi:hypothetical protein
MQAETCDIVRKLRSENSFCPDCGMNPHDPYFNRYHVTGTCRVCFPLTCSYCGHTGEDVSSHYAYVGGKGMESIPAACDDIDACYKRQEGK